MAISRSRLILNSSMNVLGGASTALVSFCIPPILARNLPALEYSVWNLVLPIVAYLGLLGAGIHLATARFISQSAHHDDPLDRQRTVRAGFALAGAGTLLALGAVAAVAAFYPNIYPDIPPEMRDGFRHSTLWIGGSAALQLLALVPLGIFTGHQQNALYVGAQVPVRAVMLGAVWWLAVRHAQLSTLAQAYAGLGVLLVPAVYGVLAQTHGGYFQALWQFPDRERVRELLAYCGGFSVWTMAGLLVHSLDTIWIGRLQILAVNPYAIALSLTTVLSGLISAVVHPLLPGVSALFGSAEGQRKLPGLLNRATFWSGILGQTIFIGFLILGRPFLHLYAAQYAEAAYPFLIVLLLACIIRQVSLPYGIFLLSTSLHGKALLSVMTEGFVNLGFSLFLGYRLGAIGVAYGTLLGAAAGQIALCLSAMPQTRQLVPSTRALLFHGFLRPTLWLTPAYLACAWFLGRSALFPNP